VPGDPAALVGATSDPVQVHDDDPPAAAASSAYPKITSTISDVRLDIHVRPNASNTHVGGTHGGVLVVRVTEPADQGRANAAAVRAVAEALEVPRRCVSLIRGSTSRRKTLEVEVSDKVRPLVESRLLLLSSGTAESPDFQAP